MKPAEIRALITKEYPYGHAHSIAVLAPTLIAQLLDQLDVARAALGELQLGHEHNTNNSDYRPLGDSYGWCSLCSSKVGRDEDIAREALSKLKEME